jgi:glutaredoxin 3
MKIEIYSADYCPHCTRAKSVFDRYGLTYTEYDITKDMAGREEAMTRSGGRKTVPQIFIDGTHIGGCDDLVAFEQSGKLKALVDKND